MNLLAAAPDTWSVIPFVLLLLAIALLPLAAPKWWHRNRNKALVGIVFGAPAVFFTLSRDPKALAHTGLEYVAFIALIGSLFVIAGGIEIRGSFSGTPLSNAGFLATGAVLANLIGTTGASMVLLRPYLKANRHRTNRTNLVVFFIFLVSNVGGLLTPLGDPPLFLGFLKGVPFQWTMTLWQPWAVVVAGVLVSFFVVDRAAAREEAPAPAPAAETIAIRGLPNVVLLLLVMGVVLAGGFWIHPKHGETASQVAQAAALAVLAGVSLAVTPAEVRRANDFSWHPFVEVAVLFAGIFAAMIPALAWLRADSEALGLTRPWQFFWATGSLSAFLDNAPTYLVFFTIAQAGSAALPRATLLSAISCGAVFFGAMTYIGNGPNFMVKAIAEHSGVKMPSFFGFMAWSCVVLLPLFLIVTALFFL